MKRGSLVLNKICLISSTNTQTKNDLLKKHIMSSIEYLCISSASHIIWFVFRHPNKQWNKMNSIKKINQGNSIITDWGAS